VAIIKPQSAHFVWISSCTFLHLPTDSISGPNIPFLKHLLVFVVMQCSVMSCPVTIVTRIGWMI